MKHEREQVLVMLREQQEELHGIGIVKLSLFGSVARGDAGPDSDIDIAVQIGEGFSAGGFDYFWKLEQLQRRLSELLGCKVDVVSEPVHRARMQSS